MIIVATMMHMKRAMRPIMIPKRIGIISLLDGVLVAFACSVDVSTTLLLEVCVVVVCIGILLSSGFSGLCGDSSLVDSIAVTVDSLADELQVLSNPGVHKNPSRFSSVHSMEHMIGLGEHPVPTFCIIAHSGLLQFTITLMLSGDVVTLVPLSQRRTKKSDTGDSEFMHPISDSVVLFKLQFNELG